MNLYLEFMFLIGCMAIACWDFLFYKIPNSAIIGVLSLALLHLFAGGVGDWHHILWVLAASFSVLVISYVLFSFKLLGAGDGKYMAVAILFLPLKSVFNFLIIMSLAGLVLAIIYKLAHTRINGLKLFVGEQLPDAYKVVEETGQTIPYGVAITAGIIGAYLLIGS